MHVLTYNKCKNAHVATSKLIFIILRIIATYICM